MSRKRWIWAGVIVLAFALPLAAAWSLRGTFAYASIATGYAAKQTCSCLHVSERELESCLSDLPEDARGNISITANENHVRASVLFGAISAEAEYEDDYGCTLLN